MRINEIHYDSGAPVDSYGTGFFRVGDWICNGPMLLLPRTRVMWGGWEDVDPILGAAPLLDLLLLGTGAEIAMPPRQLRDALEEAGIAFEFMASGPACRTYNVLLSEGRRVGIAALPV